MTVGNARLPTRQAFPAPMKAGGWHGQTDSFLGRSQEIQTAFIHVFLRGIAAVRHAFIGIVCVMRITTIFGMVVYSLLCEIGMVVYSLL